MPDPQFVSAQPSISVGGRDQPALADGLLNLSIIEDTHGLYRAEARLGNWGLVNGTIGFLYFDRQLLDFGKAFAVQINGNSVFDGLITGLEACFPEGRPPELCVLAEDRFQDLRMVRRTRTFDSVSDADVFTRIASDHGLTPSINVPGPTYAVLAQVNLSDLAFVRERARAVGAELWLEGQTLHATSRANRASGSTRLAYGNQLREFSALADLVHQRTGVAVTGWDVAAKSGLTYEATAAVISGELNGDAGGSSILASAFGDRKDVLAHTVPLTSQEAQTEAEARYRRLARRFVVGRGVAQPDARVRVGASVSLEGLGPLFSGTYYVAESSLVFDRQAGLRIEFTGERPGLGRP